MRKNLTPGRVALAVVATLVGLVVLFYLFQAVETLLPANF